MKISLSISVAHHFMGAYEILIINVQDTCSVCFIAYLSLSAKTCKDVTCYNGGTCKEMPTGPKCECPEVQCGCGTLGDQCQWKGKLCYSINILSMSKCILLNLY